MLSTHCSCLSIFILSSWITTAFQFPKLTFTFSCFHLEAFYRFFPTKFHTLADPEVWVERGTLAYSFTISGSITGFSDLGQIFYQIQRDSNLSLMHVTKTVHLHKVHVLNGNTPENWCSQTELFAQEIQVWHEAKKPNPNSRMPMQFPKHELVWHHTCWTVRHKPNFMNRELWAHCHSFVSY